MLLLKIPAKQGIIAAGEAKKAGDGLPER